MQSPVKILSLLLSSLLITACAAAPGVQTTGRYALDSRLQPVRMIRSPQLLDWEEADNQSFFIRIVPNDYYLLILRTPSHELHFQETIALAYSDNMLMPGFSSLIVSTGASMKNSYLIDRIYRINGHEEMRSIRAQLKGEPDAKD